MDYAEFQILLRDGGYADITTRRIEADERTPLHTHPFDVLALVNEGEISLTVDGTTTCYAAGEVFTMPRGCEHTEHIGPEGVIYTVGRRSA